MEENNEKINVENVNTKSTEKTATTKGSGKGTTVALTSIIIILILVVGVLTGVLFFRKGTTIVNNINEGVSKQEDLNKISKKIDESKPWVYDADYMQENKVIYGSSDRKYVVNSDECFKVPVININSKDAERVNLEIKKLYEDSYSEFGKLTKNSDEDCKAYNRDDIEYKVYQNDNILSVVVIHDDYIVVLDGGTGGGVFTTYTYNFNLDTLQEATLDEMAKVCGFNSGKEVENKINEWETRFFKFKSENPDSVYVTTYVGIQRGKYYIDNNKKLNFLYRTATSAAVDNSQIIETGKEIEDFYTIDSSNSNNTVQSNKEKVVSVKETMLEKNMIVKGFDSQGNVIWTYTTPEWTIEPLNKGQKLIGIRNNKVYLCDWGNLYVLDMQTGKIISCDTETNIGGAGKCIFDNENNLYITSYLAPLSKFDENGKKKVSTFVLWDNGLHDINKITIEKNELIAYCTDGGYARLKLDDLSIISIGGDTSNSNNANTTQLAYATEYIKIIDKLVSESPDSGIKCDLIYFNNDNIPDLVIGVNSYWVSVYIYEDGKVYNPIDEWAYGAWGNTGYLYQERKGTILNYDTDYAGAILTKTILKLNANKTFDSISNTGIGADTEKTNPEYENIMKYLHEVEGYYYNGKKISEQEYDNKIKELSINTDRNSFKSLEGDKTPEEVKKQLQ